MSKSAAAVLAFAGFMLFSIPMSAQEPRRGPFNSLLPNGNVYVGGSYGQLSDVINPQSYHGFEGSFEALPFTRFPRLGLVADGSGYYPDWGYAIHFRRRPTHLRQLRKMAPLHACYGRHPAREFLRLRL